MRYETKEEYHTRMLNQEKCDIKRNRQFTDLDNDEAQVDTSEYREWRDRANCSIDQDL